MLFAIGALFVLAVLLHYSTVISRLSDQNKILAQKANALHPFTGEHHRSEHWSNALNGGKVAAKAMLGQDAALDAVPYFYTDQFDVSMEYSGFPTLAAGAEPVIRGSLEAKEFIAFWQQRWPGGGRDERQLAADRQPPRKPSRPSSQPGRR